MGDFSLLLYTSMWFSNFLHRDFFEIGKQTDKPWNTPLHLQLFQAGREIFLAVELSQNPELLYIHSGLVPAPPTATTTTNSEGFNNIWICLNLKKHEIRVLL